MGTSAEGSMEDCRGLRGPVSKNIPGTPGHWQELNVIFDPFEARINTSLCGDEREGTPVLTMTTAAHRIKLTHFHLFIQNNVISCNL